MVLREKKKDSQSTDKMIELLEKKFQLEVENRLKNNEKTIPDSEARPDGSQFDLAQIEDEWE